MRVNVLGQAYTTKNPYVHGDTCVNYYQESACKEDNSLQTQKQQPAVVLYPTPGYTTASGASLGAARGMLAYNNFLYVVQGNFFVVYSQNTNKTLNTVRSISGVISTTHGPVSMVCNGNIGNQILMCDGVNKFYYNIGTHVLAAVTDPAGVVATQVAYQQGYGVMANFGTNQFYITNLEDFSTMNPLNFASAYTKPDPLVTVATLKQYLILFTQTGGEIWQNVGTTTINGVVTTFPYSNLTSSYLEQGCAAPFGVVLSVNTLYWVTRNERGQGQISRVGGGGLIVLSPEIISTRPIDNFLTNLPTLSDCISWSYQIGGHEFVVFTFPTGNATIVFDVTESLWHFRSSSGTSSLGSDLVTCSANLNGVQYVGTNFASINSNVYYVDPTNLFTGYNGSGIGIATYRERTTQHLCVDNTRMCISRLEVDIMTLSGAATGSLPTLSLQISRDGGHTFINYGTRSFGYDTTKNVETRVYWTLLGMSRNWVFRFSSTSAVDYVIMGVMADTEDEEQDATEGPK